MSCVGGVVTAFVRHRGRRRCGVQQDRNSSPGNAEETEGTGTRHSSSSSAGLAARLKVLSLPKTFLRPRGGGGTGGS